MNARLQFRRVFSTCRFCQEGRAWSLLRAGWLAALAALTGCATVGQFDRGAELAFQGAHLVDTAQTYRAASDPCYEEVDTFTRRLIGRTPSHAQVIGWGVGYGALHYGITRLLTDHGHDYLAAAWELLTIETTGRSIGDSIHVGVRIGAANVHPGCPAPARSPAAPVAPYYPRKSTPVVQQ